MKKKDVDVIIRKFITEHSPDEFIGKWDAADSAWKMVWNSFPQQSKRSLNGSTKSLYNGLVCRWWCNKKNPLDEKTIIGAFDTKYHKNFVSLDILDDDGHYHIGKIITSENAVEILVELSFMYNIIGVDKQVLCWEIYLKESKDHQSNITVEVIDKITKILEDCAQQGEV